MGDDTALLEPERLAPAPPAASPAGPAPAAPAKRKPRRSQVRRLLVAAVLAGAATSAIYVVTRPGPRVLPPPKLTPALTQAVLQAIAPGWPVRKPALPTAAGALDAEDGRIDAIAAVDVDGDMLPEWGVAYAWLGPPDAAGARAVLPGFAIVRAHRDGTCELLYEAPGAGDWEGPRGGAFDAATESSARVEAVRWSQREVGFVASHVVETSVGGRMARGVTRAYLPLLGGWVPAWEGETETRLRHDRRDEVARDGHVEVLDVDQNGTAELVVTPSWYHRHLGAGDRGVHFTAEGPGRLVYRRDGAGFTLAALDGAASGPRPRLRPTPPLYAVRVPAPLAIDGDFRDWDAHELTELASTMLDEPGQLRYKRRDRRGTQDFSGALRFAWDATALYVRADVMDDKLRPAPAGRTLFEGDHLALWLDMDLQRDFAVARRDGDDWQVGLAPDADPIRRVGGGHSWIWVPKAGQPAARVASAPLLDPYEGAVRGWRLEAAIPWAELGGPPPLRAGVDLDTRDARQELAPRRYALRYAGAVGLAAVLTDADDEPQELAYVTAPTFAWEAPRTFNTLLLVEGQRQDHP